MIANYINTAEAERRFKTILTRYREAAEREKREAGNNSFVDKDPIKFDEEKQLITVRFLHFTAFYQLLGNGIELWMNADQGIDDEMVSRKMTNLFNALRSSTQHFAPKEEPETENVTPDNGIEAEDDHFERNLTLLKRWLDNNDLTIRQLEEELGLPENGIIRQLRRSKYGKFKTWWRHNIILGGNNEQND